MRRVLLGLAIVSGIAGCQPAFDSVDVEAVSTPPVEVTVRDFLVELPTGVAVVVEVTPRSGNRHDYDDKAVVELESEDAHVMTVYARPEPRQFVLVGVDPGETCLQVRIDAVVHECISVVVEPPAGD